MRRGDRQVGDLLDVVAARLGEAGDEAADQPGEDGLVDRPGQLPRSTARATMVRNPSSDGFT